jgi:hypothetical protein
MQGRTLICTYARHARRCTSTRVCTQAPTHTITNSRVCTHARAPTRTHACTHARKHPQARSARMCAHTHICTLACTCTHAQAHPNARACTQSHRHEMSPLDGMLCVLARAPASRPALFPQLTLSISCRRRAQQGDRCCTCLLSSFVLHVLTEITSIERSVLVNHSRFCTSGMRPIAQSMQGVLACLPACVCVHAREGCPD